MSSIFFHQLISAVGLAGVYFNTRMLLICFKNKTKCSSIQKLRPFVICQFVYQVTSIGTTDVKAWTELDVQHQEYCSVLRMLSISTQILLSCNLIAIAAMITPEQSNVDKRRHFCTKLFIVAAAQCLGSISLAVFSWHSCFLHDSVPQGFIVIASVFFLLLLLLTSVKNIQLDQVYNREELKASSLCAFLKENKTFILGAAWLLLCYGVIKASDAVPWMSLGEQNGRFLHAFMLNTVAGVVLPLAIIDLLNSSYENSELKTYVI